MADEKEKRTLLGDIQKNIIDKIGNENIMEGDITRYKVPKKLPEVPIKTIERQKKKVIETLLSNTSTYTLPKYGKVRYRIFRNIKVNMTVSMLSNILLFLSF